MLQAKMAIPDEYDPYYGYDKFIAGRPTTSASVSETILQNPTRIWALIRDFGRIDEWWKGFFTDLRMVHGGPTDSVGAERAFNGNGVSYREVLLLNDDEEMRQVYGLTYASSPHILAAVTTIDVDPVPGASDKCTVTWSSVSQPALSCRIVANEIRERQLRAYSNGLRSLQSYYQSELGSVEVSIQTGRLVLPGHHHLHLSVGFTEIMVPLTRKGSPQKNEKYKYSIFSEGDDLLFELVDCSSEKISAIGSLVLSGLSKTTHAKVPIRNPNGDTIGAFVVEITVTRPTAEAAVPNPATAVGTVVLAVAKDLQRKVQEIAAYMAQQLLNPDKEEIWEYASYNGETGDEPFGRLPKYCKILPYSSVIQPKRTGELFQRSTEYLYSQAILLGVENPLDLVEDGDPFKLPFRNWMPTPQKVIDRHKDDEEIAAQLLRGVNPVKITLATSVYDLPAEFHSLYVAAEGKSLRDLAGSKRIFYCDYWEVAVGEYNEEGGYYSHQAMAPANLGTFGPLKYWYAPFLVVYKRENGDLNIVGFTLTRYSDKPNVVFMPNSHPPNIYQLAKFHLTCADNQHHQFCTHLGLAHLVMEPFAVANNNVFMNVKDGKPHPVGALLEPHFKDTIGINFLARQTLVSEVAPLTDATFSPGTVNALKIFSRSYKNWDVVGDNFVNALKKRGFDEGCSDELPNYYYREDGFKVWNILFEFIGSVVQKIYPTDAAVGADEKLSQWCEELRDPERGDLRTFPASISSRSFLTEILTSIVFYCSAQHSAVNFAQLRYVSYVPNRPDSMTKPMPADLNKEIGLEELYSALPSFINVEFQTLFAYLLTTPPDNPFSEYLGVEKDFPEETALLRKNMDQLHRDIRARNKALEAKGRIGYEFLDPVNIAQSINI